MGVVIRQFSTYIPTVQLEISQKYYSENVLKQWRELSKTMNFFSSVHILLLQQKTSNETHRDIMNFLAYWKQTMWQNSGSKLLIIIFGTKNKAKLGSLKTAWQLWRIVDLTLIYVREGKNLLPLVIYYNMSDNRLNYLSTNKLIFPNKLKDVKGAPFRINTKYIDNSIIANDKALYKQLVIFNPCSFDFVENFCLVNTNFQ